jgi:ketosteroid isomerase-like protein
MAAEGVSQTQDDIHDVVGNDEHVIALVRMTLTAPAGTASTNSAFIYHVRDGKAVEFWAINDNQAAIDALLA